VQQREAAGFVSGGQYCDEILIALGGLVFSVIEENHGTYFQYLKRCTVYRIYMVCQSRFCTAFIF
jgi:hypothetical protein